MKRIILIVVVFLSGCVTFNQMDSGLQALVGKNKTRAFEVLGYPNQEQQFDEIKLYTWTTLRTGMGLYTFPTTTQGTFGNQPFQGTTTQTELVPVQYNCKIQLATDSQGIIKSYDYTGDLSGCELYITRLNERLKK